MGPKLDDLVHVLLTEINLTELQEKLHGELSNMKFFTSLQLFKVTNFLAKEHDLLRVFFFHHAWWIEKRICNYFFVYLGTANRSFVGNILLGTNHDHFVELMNLLKILWYFWVNYDYLVEIMTLVEIITLLLTTWCCIDR